MTRAIHAPARCGSSPADKSAMAEDAAPLDLILSAAVVAELIERGVLDEAAVASIAARADAMAAITLPEAAQSDISAMLAQWSIWLRAEVSRKRS